MKCQLNLQIMKSICKCLCFPLALEKLEGPVILLVFLGILIDTVDQELRLPIDKLRRIRDLVQTWLGKKR